MNRKKTFREWLNSFPTMSAKDLHTRPDFAFSDEWVPEEDLEVFRAFELDWHNRFSTKTSLAEIKTPGWYNIQVGALKGTFALYPERLRGIFNCWNDQKLKDAAEDWKKSFLDEGDTAPVVAEFGIEQDFGPWAKFVTRPMTEKRLALAASCTGNYPHDWELFEVDGKFSVRIFDGAGTTPLLRAMNLIEWHRSGWYNDTALFLEWIFAAGQKNVLQATDDALSGRSSTTVAQARKMVRAVL